MENKYNGCQELLNEGLDHLCKTCKRRWLRTSLLILTLTLSLRIVTGWRNQEKNDYFWRKNFFGKNYWIFPCLWKKVLGRRDHLQRAYNVSSPIRWHLTCTWEIKRLKTVTGNVCVAGDQREMTTLRESFTWQKERHEFTHGPNVDHVRGSQTQASMKRTFPRQIPGVRVEPHLWESVWCGPPTPWGLKL